MAIPKDSTQVILRQAPTGFVNPNFDEPSSTFAIKQTAIPELQNGQLLVKTLLISNDPTQRGWIRSKNSNKRYYVEPTYEGEPMSSLAIAEVVESKSEKYQKGDIVNGKFFWADYIIVEEKTVINAIDKSLGFPLEFFLSVLGMTSLTALFGLTEAGGLKKYFSEKPKELIVLVSAASGATGSIVVQIAKHLLGATKVIGISGSAEKCRWVEGLGADLCVNYKDSGYQQEITKYLGDKLVNVYYDNVGGEILSFALTKMAKYGRVISCGSISSYNSSESPKITNWGEITVNSLTVSGFLVTDYISRFPEGIDILSKAVKEGKIKTEGAYHVETLTGDSIEEKLEKIPKIWNQLFTGDKPNGKLITKVA
ncbi:hypothetical protein KGF56_000456 [Candida oxycetoniae]|uniref:Enoyl reductase (ER) domain-containing protein n=1 Tax=Candida oxycetoniae TaxID=497107 RepID=A0AAI9X0C8_9ASCO|nr:uncharacterized protein KGF56_000456 [Candida oxycetoniae]KAI3406850.1 hypothetical protein KGF56_000456 [Candida oxycetoniae]